MENFRTTYRRYSILRRESYIDGTSHVAVLYGGMSAEREVSLVSGSAIIKSLIESGYSVTSIDVGADLGHVLQQLHPDVVFNALHGTYGEDGCIPGLLNIMKIPYTHSGVLASAIAFDKMISRNIFIANGIKCAEALIVHKNQNLKTDPLPRPYVIKPLREGSSIGVHVVFEGDDFNFANYAFEYGDKILVEKYITGREMQVCVLNGKVLGVLEIKLLKSRFYDYEAKYTEGFAEHILPANLSQNNTRKVMILAEKAYEAIGCRGLARIEFIYSDQEDEVYILELNTHPGFTPLSICQEIAAHQGMNFNALVEDILKNARCD